MVSNPQYLLRADITRMPWITTRILLDEHRSCRALVCVCKKCNMRADVNYFSWCDVHQSTGYNCGKRYTTYYRGCLTGEICDGCSIISRGKTLKHPSEFRKNHPERRKQKKSRALAPFDRDKKKRRKYRGPKKIGEKRKKLQALVLCTQR